MSSFINQQVRDVAEAVEYARNVAVKPLIEILDAYKDPGSDKTDAIAFYRAIANHERQFGSDLVEQLITPVALAHEHQAYLVALGYDGRSLKVWENSDTEGEVGDWISSSLNC